MAGDNGLPLKFSRRAVLGGALAGAAAVALAPGRVDGANMAEARRPGPGSLPNPKAPAGSDQLPDITTIIAVMLENHTYDNILVLLPGRGDGFVLGRNGHPTASNPGPKGKVVHAFPMPTPCQLSSHPCNTWDAGHESYHGGRMDGFVKSKSGPVSMGYFEPSVLPFTNSLATTFPMCDQYFSSVMAQTYPNRRYFMAGTSLGQIADVINGDRPPNGTIFEMLNAHGISWKNYYVSGTPSIFIWTFLSGKPGITPNLAGIDQFYSDAAAGTLPAFSMVDPNFGRSSEENPQDVQFGDQFLSQVVNAVMASPQWPHALLVWTYDEGGGYYDHVPPPRAVKPDAVPPSLGSTDKAGQFNRYGFRLPSGVVSPFARADCVSSVVHDHTSILKLIETK
jgi:phospholipase C